MTLLAGIIPFALRCFVSRVPENVLPLIFRDDVMDFSGIFSGA
jgi:hypothetical protein